MTRRDRPLASCGRDEDWTCDRVNPAIVIPTYWTEGEQPGDLGERGAYDYATPIDKPMPELESCLASLEQVRGVLRTIVLVVAPPSCSEGARARVNGICRMHPNLNPLVVGEPEAAVIERAVASVSPHDQGETVALRGYGAIKNMGLAVAAAFGHDSVVFLADDEVVESPDFLTDAVWGLTAYTRQDLRILAKSGFYVDEDGSPYAPPKTAWSERRWTKAAEFNKVMERAQHSKNRVTRSNHLCAGCCAVHAEAYTAVPFDPYITRGEDLDYVLNLRSHGLDVWFDNQWWVRLALPEEMASAPSMFMQDVHRWLYEYRKLDALNARRDLRTITPESLMPYPAPWLSGQVRGRILGTALRRLVACPEHGDYLRILLRGIWRADRLAKAAASKYLSFCVAWRGIALALWDQPRLQRMLLATGDVCGLAAPAAGRSAAREMTESGRSLSSSEPNDLEETHQ